MINFHKISKSIIYRPYSMLITTLVVFIITGDFKIGLTIGFLDACIKIITYYLFDVLWDKIFNKKIKPCVIFLTGLSGSGKTTIGNKLFNLLKNKGQKVIMLDGDEIRKIFPQTGFDEESRKKHNLNIGYMSSFFEKQEIVCIVTVISPYEETRNKIRNLCNNFIEVYVNTPIEVCEKRDPKGLYKKVRNNEIKSFTGIHEDAPYEKPTNPEVVIDTVENDLDSCVKKIINVL